MTPLAAEEFSAAVAEVKDQVLAKGWVEIPVFAKVIKRSPRTVQRWIACGLVRTVRIGERQFVDMGSVGQPKAAA